MKIMEPMIKNEINKASCMMIIDEDLYKNGWVYNYFIKIVMDKSKQQLEFLDYDFFWNKGIHIKKHVDYPWEDSYDPKKLMEFLYGNMDRGYYIIANVDEFERDFVWYQGRFLIYDYEKETHNVSYCYCDKNNNLYVEKIHCDKIFRYMHEGKQKEIKMFCFDMFKKVKNDNLCFDISQICMELECANIKSRYYRVFVNNMSEDNIKYSICVLKQWLNIMRERLKFIKTLELTTLEVEIVQRLIQFDEILKNMDNNSKKALTDLIPLYNDICRLLLEHVRKVKRNHSRGGFVSRWLKF